MLFSGRFETVANSFQLNENTIEAFVVIRATLIIVCDMTQN